MAIPSTPDTPIQPQDGSAATEPAALDASIDGFRIALKAVQIVVNASITTADQVPADTANAEVRLNWLASLMTLRYAMQLLQFRSSNLLQAVTDKLGQG